MIRRLLVVFASSAIAAIAACSSFEEGQEGSSSSSGGPGGEAGTIDGGGDEVAPPPCNDTSTDGRNCGSCGHDCLGGSCVGGFCQPVEIAHTSDAPVKSIAVSATRVLWMTSSAGNDEVGSLYSCPKNGCANGVPEQIFAAENSMGTLAGDGTTIWASLAYGAKRVEMFGPTGGPTQVAAFAQLNRLFAMEVQSSRLYVVNQSDVAGNGRYVFSWKPGDDALTTVGTFVEPGTTVNTQQASFTTNRVFLGAVNTNWITTCALDACTSWDKFGSPAASIASMTNDDQRLYWIESDIGAVNGCTAAATCEGQEVLVTASQLGSQAFTVSYSHASKKLAILTKANEVVECDPAKCESSKRVLAKGAPFDQTYAVYGNVIAADERSVYYATIDGTTHTVMRIAR